MVILISTHSEINRKRKKSVGLIKNSRKQKIIKGKGSGNLSNPSIHRACKKRERLLQG